MLFLDDEDLMRRLSDFLADEVGEGCVWEGSPAELADELDADVDPTRLYLRLCCLEDELCSRGIEASFTPGDLAGAFSPKPPSISLTLAAGGEEQVGGRPCEAGDLLPLLSDAVDLLVSIDSRLSGLCARDFRVEQVTPEEELQWLEHGEETDCSGWSAALAAGPSCSEGSAPVPPAALQRAWKQVVDGLVKSAPPKGSLLLGTFPVSDDGETLSIGLPAGSRFALKMLDRADVRAVVEPAISAVFGPRRYTVVEQGGAPAPEPEYAPIDAYDSFAPESQPAADYPMPWDIPATVSAAAGPAAPQPTASAAPSLNAAGEDAGVVDDRIDALCEKAEVRLLGDAPDCVAWSLGEDRDEENAPVEDGPLSTSDEPALVPNSNHLSDMEKIVSFIEEKVCWRGGAGELGAAVGLSIAPSTIGSLLNSNEEWLAFRGVVHERPGSRDAYDRAHRLYLSDAVKRA